MDNLVFMLRFANFLGILIVNLILWNLNGNAYRAAWRRFFQFLLLGQCWLIAGEMALEFYPPLAFIAERPVRPLVFNAIEIVALYNLIFRFLKLDGNGHKTDG